MLKQRTKRSSKITAIILSLMMVVVFMPTFAFAADGDADGITVYLTVSDKGDIAKANDGSLMAWKEVSVKDINEDGHYTFDEALTAAHAAYNSADGFVYKASSGWVDKLWGESGSFSFITNNVAEMSVVTETEIKDQDYLVASINQDASLYADWNTYFDNYQKHVLAGETITLNLSGYQAMTVNDPAAAKNVQIGYWENGEYKDLEGVKTDENGNASFSFDKPGTYVVTAKGAVQDVVDAATLYVLMEVANDKEGTPVYGKMDWNTGDSWVGYTEKDYGTGPYPWNEIQWLELFDEDYNPVYNPQTFDKGHLLYSGDVLADCPIIAPACVVKVVAPAEPADVTVTVNNKGALAAAKDGGVMVEKKVTVKDINEDGHLTVDEALVAAHEKYHADGAAAYATGDPFGYGLMVTKLWGVDTTNTLFYVNDQGLATGVTDDEVKEGDSIYASVNADDMYYADWFATFTEKNTAVEIALSNNANLPDDFTMSIDVELVGHYGMGYTPEELKNVPLEGIQIGYIDNRGEFAPLEGAVTDASGKATATFDSEDFDHVGADLVLTAKGTVKYEVTTDWSTGETAVVDCPIMAPYMVVEADVKMGGTVEKLRAEAAQELMASFDMSDYRLKEQLQVLTLVVKAQAEFSSAKNSSDIKRILNDAKAELAAITTDAQYKAQEAAVKKIQVKGVNVTAGKKQATVKWTKNTKFDGYQISYKKAGASAKTVKVTKNTTTKKVIKKLAKGKKYTFKVRGFKKIDGKVIYGKWSAAKTKKIK